jgi:glutamate-1-semialdehyde 2,1-aminomutase
LAQCEGLESLFHSPPMFVTGRGSMVNVRFSGPDAAVWQSLFYHHMLSQNINIAVRGYTPLHLMLTENDIRLYISEVERFVKLHAHALCPH